MTTKFRRSALAVFPLLCLFAVSSAASSAQGSTVAPPDKNIKATLKIWTYDQAQRDNKIQQAEFKKLYPNVKFTVVFIPQEQFANKIIASATAKSGPDIIWENPAYTQAFADAGVVRNLSTNWKSYSDASQFPVSVVNKVNGNVYGVQTYSNLNALWYNKTLLDSLGLSVPSSLDGLELDLSAVKAAGKVGLEIAGTPGIEGEWISKPFFTDYGVNGYKELGKPNVLTALTRLADWVNKGYINKGDLNLSQGDGIKKFLGGDTAFFVGGNWQLADGAKASFNWGVTPMVKGPNGPGIVYLGGQAEAIGAFSKNPALAWEFFKQTWLSKQFETATLAFGSIPSRKDALPKNASQQITAYASAIAHGVPISSDTAKTLLVGNLWSAVLSGQQSPADGAASAGQIAKTAK